MKSIFSYLIAIIVIFQAVNVFAGSDQLKKVDDIFDKDELHSEYYLHIKELLFTGLSDVPEIRFLAVPCFYPEHVMEIEWDDDDEKYYLIYHICDSNIYYSRNWKALSIKRIKKEITENSVNIIKALYEAALYKHMSSYVVMSGVVDGEDYYFTTGSEGLTGKIYSPDDGTNMNELINISYELIKLAESGQNLIEFDDKLIERINKLIKKLE